MKNTVSQVLTRKIQDSIRSILSIPILILCINSGYSHSTAAFYVTDGTSCYFVLPNWHGAISDQNQAIAIGDGVYFDVNGDGLYVGSISTGGSSFTPQTTNSSEFNAFTEIIDISDRRLSSEAFSNWQCEIMTWFKTTKNKDVSVTLVWDPSNDPNCSSNPTFGNLSLFALVAPFPQCHSNPLPTIANAAIGATSATAIPCIMSGSFSVNTSSASSSTCLEVVPTMTEWSIFYLALLFLILLTVTLKKRIFTNQIKI